MSTADFFVYACIRQYEQLHSIRSYDGSLGYVVEGLDADAAALDRLAESARKAASTIPAPDYGDPEHGLPSVAILCRDAARAVTRPPVR